MPAKGGKAGDHPVARLHRPDLAAHRFDDPGKPITWQGFTSKGATTVHDNVWCGANVVVTSGVTIGERSVIGANSVVTTDIEPYSIAAGAPARVLRKITY